MRALTCLLVSCCPAQLLSVRSQLFSEEEMEVELILRR